MSAEHVYQVLQKLIDNKRVKYCGERVIIKKLFFANDAGKVYALDTGDLEIACNPENKSKAIPDRIPPNHVATPVHQINKNVSEIQVSPDGWKVTMRLKKNKPRAVLTMTATIIKSDGELRTSGSSFDVLAMVVKGKESTLSYVYYQGKDLFNQYSGDDTIIRVLQGDEEPFGDWDAANAMVELSTRV